MISGPYGWVKYDDFKGLMGKSNMYYYCIIKFKIMKKILFTLVICCFSYFGFAQGSIAGRVMDSLNNKVELAHIMIFQEDEFQKGTITSENGKFEVPNLETGSYLLKIEAMGYADYAQEFILESGNTDLGNLKLKPGSIVLDDVELVGKKRLYRKKENSLLINVEQQIAGAGGSVLELLRSTAGITFNQQNGNLSLNGKGQVAIMVDGKLSRMDGPALISLLKSMPASDIKNLEIFNNPPSRYEASGSGGLINIMTKSRTNNTQGGALTLLTGYGQGEKLGAASNFHLQYGKIGLFGNYAFNRNDSPEEWGLESEFDNPQSQKMVKTNSFRKPIILSHNYMFGSDYALHKNTRIGATLSGYSSKWDMVALDKVVRNSNNGQMEFLDIETNEINHWTQIAGNFHLEQLIGEHKLTLDYDHLYYKDDNPSNYQFEEAGQFNYKAIEKETPISFNVFNLDYNGALSEKLSLETGIKSTSSNFQNHIDVTSIVGENIIRDEELSNSTAMDEKIWAAYTSVNFKLNDKTKFTSGLRFEHTNNTLVTEEGLKAVERNYWNLFPNLIFTHQLSDTKRFQLYYNKRINRPTFNQLAPYVLFLGPDALYSGNVNLQPAFVNKFGIEWAWSGSFLNLEYLTEKDAIVEFQPRLSSNGEQYVFKAENMDRRNIISLNTAIPLRLFSWWQNENNFNLQYTYLENQIQGEPMLKRDKLSFRVSMSHQFNLAEATTLEINGYYESATLFGVSTFGRKGAVNLGIKQKIGNNADLKLSLSNLFASDNWNISTDRSRPFINSLETYFIESKIYSLTYTRNFGATKKRSKYISKSAEEEKKRVQ